MSDGEYTRRTLLRRGTAAIGTGAIASTAGCFGLNPLGGGGGYTNWLPAPDELLDEDHYYVTSTNLGTLAANEDTLGGEPDSLESTWDPVTLDWDEVSTVTSMAVFTSVVQANFNRDDVVEDLEDDDFDDDTDHEGFTIYLSGDEQQAFGVGDGTLVISAGYGSGDADPVDQVETVIDASNGNVERYTAASEDMQTLVNKLGGGAFLSADTYEEQDDDNPEDGNLENSVAQGTSITINGETSAYKTVVVYESADDVDTDDLEDWVDANDGSSSTDGTRFDDVDDISYNADGRAGVISGTIDTDILYEDN